MGGFKNSSLNFYLKQGLYDIIIDGLIDCCLLMSKSCIEQSRKILNHEEKIRTHLVENYLENDIERRKTSLSKQHLRFEVEAQENYDNKNESYEGRVDIKVISKDTLADRRAYYIIECKRIDGKETLNKKYITEGVQRFITEKYSSHYGKNIMLGFIVKDINIQSNIQKINSLNQNILYTYIDTDMLTVRSDSENNYAVCESKYKVKSKLLLLNHIFYNFSSIIR